MRAVKLTLRICEATHRLEIFENARMAEMPPRRRDICIVMNYRSRIECMDPAGRN